MPPRKKDEFGTPWARDGTAYLERIVKSAGDTTGGYLKHLTQDTFPRPLGSQRVPIEHQVAEIEAVKDDPQMLQAIAADREWSLETFVEYLEKMAERAP